MEIKWSANHYIPSPAHIVVISLWVLLKILIFANVIGKGQSLNFYRILEHTTHVNVWLCNLYMKTYFIGPSCSNVALLYLLYPASRVFFDLSWKTGMERIFLGRSKKTARRAHLVETSWINHYSVVLVMLICWMVTCPISGFILEQPRLEHFIVWNIVAILLPANLPPVWNQSTLNTTSHIIILTTEAKARDGEDGNGLKLEKNWPVLTSLETLSSERHKNLNLNSSLCRKYISYIVSGLSGMLYVS